MVSKQNSDVYRFLWDIDGPLNIMRFLGVHFGNCLCSYLLNATIQHHLSLLPGPSRMCMVMIFIRL